MKRQDCPGCNVTLSKSLSIVWPTLQIKSLCFDKAAFANKAAEYRDLLQRLHDYAHDLSEGVESNSSILVTNIFKDLDKMDTHDIENISFLYAFCFKNPHSFLKTKFDFMMVYK